MSGVGRRTGGDGFGTWLRRRSDAELAALFAVRPDLVTPAPAGIDALASRAARPLSLERALDGLDRFSLHVIEALLALPSPVAAGSVQGVLGVSPGALNRCLAALRARALAWQTEDGYRPAPGLRAVISAPRLPEDPGRVSAEPPPLDGTPIGDSADSHPAGSGPVPSAPGSRRVVPRGSRRDPGGQHSPDGSHEVDAAAAAAALNALRCIEDLLNRWADAPPPVLRSGGLGIRELRKAAASVRVDLATAALLTEVARAAGLLAASGWTDGEWLPSHVFDAWRESADAERWATIVGAWQATTRVPGLVGARDEAGRLLNALGNGLDRMDAPRVRALVLRELATAAPGTSVSTDAMLRRLTWLSPRRPAALQAMLAETALREAAVLGLTGRGALAAPGRAAASGGLAEATAVLAMILPEPVGHVLLQADMTAVAPGPLTAELARELSLAAEVESTGGATVYRFSAGSVRRAMDAGRSGDDLLALLAERSRTPIPQPLRYLIEDAARRHGRIRVGAASAYIRCDDPAIVAEIAADRRAAGLRLRPLAPTVLVSSSRRGEVLAVLRRLGYAPAAESADGTVEITAAGSRRAGDPASKYGTPAAPGPPQSFAPWPAHERALAAVRVLRSGGP
ncbi:MAG TPA: helicase-associated domain-containing protein [Streptosporangiaceae bacterium]|nr:helicase-associated domain-containing protein [Streptosporangiaceae bacterium]